MTRRNLKSNKEYVYLIREREFVRLEEDTYKIGRTRLHPESRLGCYPKDSEVLLLCDVSNCKSAEAALKERFGKLFQHRKKYGVEYFGGDCELMKAVMTNTIYQSGLIPKRWLRPCAQLKPLPTLPAPKNNAPKKESAIMKMLWRKANEEPKKESAVLKLIQKYKKLPVPPLLVVKTSQFMCPKCSRHLSTKQKLTQHLNKKISCDMKCRDCDFVAKDRHQFYRHKQTHRGR